MTANTGGKADSEDAARVRRLDRLTVALVPSVTDDLQCLQDRTGLSKTDIINRAITLYEFIDAQLRSDNDLIIRNSKTGETQLVRFLLCLVTTEAIRHII
jgi:hypothetical protein